MKKNILLTMLLLMATMAFAACTGKKSTIQKDAAAQTDTFKTKSGKEIIFTAIKHGSIRITFDGREIEVDPVRGLSRRRITPPIQKLTISS